MPRWSQTIPEKPKGPALPILRTPAFKPLTAIITSNDLVGTFTHYFHGRTCPCEAPDCEACREGIPYRWHAYLSAIDCDNGLHFLFEVTAAGAEPFISYRDAHTTLRGCLFQARRWNSRPNGRILIQTKPADLTKRSLPPGPDLIKCLAILWDLPSNGLKAKGHNPEKRTNTVLVDPVPLKDVLDDLPQTQHPHPN